MQNQITLPVEYEERPLRDGLKLGVMRLNSERSLNALSLEMIESLKEQLPIWEKDPAIIALWLEGAGEKAFCAGGNVVDVQKSLAAGDTDKAAFATQYFTEEYQLDYYLHEFPKPIICWANGFVMGGGMGLMMGSSHRLVTEKSRLAMPEISIGLYPDVGATWFLNQIPEAFARFMGLTACQLNGEDARMLGLGSHFVRSEDKEAILTAIQEHHWQGNSAADIGNGLTYLFAGYEETAQDLRPQSNLMTHKLQIEHLMAGERIQDIAQRMANIYTDDHWLERAQASFQSGSPLSAHLIFQQLQKGRDWGLKETFQHELDLSVQICRMGDFQEGVRALLVDKDKSPQWLFKRIDEVADDFVQRFFVSPWDEWQQPHPLADL